MRPSSGYRVKVTHSSNINIYARRKRCVFFLTSHGRTRNSLKLCSVAKYRWHAVFKESFKDIPNNNTFNVRKGKHL